MAREVSWSGFLVKTRGISQETLKHPRFRGRWREDDRRNAVFPYYRAGRGLVAVERRNWASTGASKSWRSYTTEGETGAWISAVRPEDRRLFVVESPIDAMSHFELAPSSTTRYAAIRQGLPQCEVEALVRAMPAGSEIIAGFDGDAAGRGYAEALRQAVEVVSASRGGYMYAVHMPAEGLDWNNVLRARKVAVAAKEEHEIE